MTRSPSEPEGAGPGDREPPRPEASNSGAPDRVPGESVFRALLRLHTASFRKRYGRDMVELFRDAWAREAREKGPAGRCAFWIRVGAGTVRAGLTERGAGLFRGGRGGDEHGSRLERTLAQRIEHGKTGGMMTRFMRDLGFAVRGLWKHPGFAGAVMVTLALGIGANTAVFSVLHGVLLAPLPWEDGQRLVRLYNSYDSDPDEPAFLSWGAFDQYRQKLESVELAAVYTYEQESADLTDGDQPERVKVTYVGSDYFDVLGVDPMLGRTFRQDEERADARVAVVSHRIWLSYLDGAPDAVGRSITLDGESHTVVGVLPAGFADPVLGPQDVFTPQDLSAESDWNNWDNHYLSAYGRLAPGVTLEQARAEVALQSQRNRELDPNAQSERGRLVPLRQDLVGQADHTLLLLMGAVGFVLLIACVNVASLQLARGASRSRELAIRAAMGSGRGALIRQLLVESVTLALGGGLLGMALGHWVVQGLVAMAPASYPGLDTVGMSLPVFGFGLALALLSGILFGLAPALRFSRVDLDPVLRQSSAGSGEARSSTRLRDFLVVSEVALALVLLVGAGILIKSFEKLNSTDTAITAPDDVLTFQVNLPEARYDEIERARFHTTLHERIESLPAVEAVSAVSWLPVTGSYHDWGTFHVDPEAEEVLGRTQANQRVIEGDYFETLGIPLLRGRTFGPQDGPDDPRRFIISRSLAEELFPDEDPLGRPLWIGGGIGEVVGVVADVPVTRRGEIVHKAYHSHTQFAGNRNWTLFQLVRLGPGSDGVLAQIRSELAALDPNLVLYEPRRLGQVMGAGVAAERFAMILLAAFSGVALLLALVGIYGVLAHSVTRRRREIGVRMALGARAGAVQGMVVRKGLLLAGLGVLLGSAGALGLTRILRSMVFEVSVTDPVVFASVAAGLLVTAALASWLPAGRAARVTPVEAFREGGP